MSHDTAVVESDLVDLTDVDLSALPSLAHADLASAVARLLRQVRGSGCSVSGYNPVPPSSLPVQEGEPPSQPSEPAAPMTGPSPPMSEGGAQAAGLP